MNKGNVNTRELYAWVDVRDVGLRLAPKRRDGTRLGTRVQPRPRRRLGDNQLGRNRGANAYLGFGGVDQRYDGASVEYGAERIRNGISVAFGDGTTIDLVGRENALLLVRRCNLLRNEI